MKTPREWVSRMPINGHSFEFDDWVRAIQDDAIRTARSIPGVNPTSDAARERNEVIEIIKSAYAHQFTPDHVKAELVTALRLLGHFDETNAERIEREAWNIAPNGDRLKDEN